MKISKTEIERIRKVIATQITQSERDALLAHMIVALHELAQIVRDITKKVEKGTPVSFTKKEKQVIEDSISVGPAWLNFSRKTRRKL